MNNPLVSIIIPVYNSEKYLNECIISLLNQTLKNCEFIFVNDGSTDNSRDIINKYKQSDNRIKLIDQENQGVSAARNRGLNEAIGDYIGFVDADDYVKEDMYEQLYNYAREGNYELILSNYIVDRGNIKESVTYDFSKESTINRMYIEKVVLPCAIETDCFSSIWNKIYKSSVIHENKIKFTYELSFGEDYLFNLNVLSKISNMKYVDYTGYYYREVEGSISRNFIENDYFQKTIELYKQDYKKIFDEAISDREVYNLISIKLINHVMAYIYRYTNLKDTSHLYRYRYISNMTHNTYVQKSLTTYLEKYKCKIGKYEKFILNMMKNKMTLFIYIATLYSIKRNND